MTLALLIVGGRLPPRRMQDHTGGEVWIQSPTGAQSHPSRWPSSWGSVTVTPHTAAARGISHPTCHGKGTPVPYLRTTLAIGGPPGPGSNRSHTSRSPPDLPSESRRADGQQSTRLKTCRDRHTPTCTKYHNLHDPSCFPIPPHRWSSDTGRCTAKPPHTATVPRFTRRTCACPGRTRKCTAACPHSGACAPHRFRSPARRSACSRSRFRARTSAG